MSSVRLRKWGEPKGGTRIECGEGKRTKEPCPSDLFAQSILSLSLLYIAEKEREIIPHPSVNRRTLSGTAALAICSPQIGSLISIAIFQYRHY